MGKPANTNLTGQLRINSLVSGSHWSASPLTSAQKKAAEVLWMELGSLPCIISLDRILTITVTFTDPIPCRKARAAIITRALNRLFRKHFLFGVTIFDRSETGRPHYHIIVVGPESANYRGEFDFAAWDQFCSSEQRWSHSGHTDQVAEGQMQAATSQYAASATPDLRTVWALLRREAEALGLGRMNAIPVRHPIAYSLYHAKCVTNVYRMRNPEDRRLRRYRFWGNFPRVVFGKFMRLTKGATRWRGRLAFCALLLGFTDYEDFESSFGKHWFIHLRGIIRIVPTEVAIASLLTPNLPLALFQKYQKEIRKVKMELLGRVDRYGHKIADTHHV